MLHSKIISSAFILFVSLMLKYVESSGVTFPLYISKLFSSPVFSTSYVFLKNDSRNFNIFDSSDQGYYVALYIGTPPQQVNVLVDTGSSNFAVNAVPNHIDTKYFNPNRSSSFIKKNINVAVPYIKGSWKGFLGSDIVLISNLSPVRVDVACIMESTNFFINGSEWEGILGLGYPAIAKPLSLVEPLFDAVVHSRKIQDVFSIRLCGIENEDHRVGSLSFGEIDPEYDRIYYTPLHREWYYDVVLTEIAVGEMKMQIDCKELNNNKTIIDSGTTNMRLPWKVFNLLLEMLQDQIHDENSIPNEFWDGTNFMCITKNDTFISDFPKLYLSMILSSNSTFMLVILPEQYLRQVYPPKIDNFNCYVFAVSPSDSGTVLGVHIMEGFLVVFDRRNKKVGFAQSNCIPSDSSELVSRIKGPFYHPDPWSCAFEDQRDTSTQLILYFAIALAAICAIPIIALVFCNLRQKYQNIWQKKDGQLVED